MADTNLRWNDVDLDEIFLKQNEDYLVPGYLKSGNLYTWGQNDFGQLGLDNTTLYSSPVQVGTDSTWTSATTNLYNTSAIKNNTLWAWGYNFDGQLGLNDTIDRSSPVQVGTDTDWRFVTMRGVSSFGIKTNGTLWAWGSNANGDLGTNNTIYYSSPVQVGTDTDWLSITPRFSIKTNRTLWGWGPNSNGQLGLNDTITRSSPVQVGTSAWSRISSISPSHSAGIKTDGTLWTWGSNSNGQLGQNNTITRSSPVQVGTQADWKEVIVANFNEFSSTFAIKTNNTLWAFGGNATGILGLNNRIQYSSPVQVGTLTNWKNIGVGEIATIEYYTFGIKTDGTLWAWGTNSRGQLGLNNTITRSSPVQVGTLTNWKSFNLIF